MNQDDLFHVLKDLVELYRMGGLTQSEFQETKRLLLSQLHASHTQSSQSEMLGHYQDEVSSPTHIPPHQEHYPTGYADSHSPVEVMEPTRSQPAFAVSGQYSSDTLTPAVFVGHWLMGRYQIKRFLGEGGTGQTFLCYDSIRQNQYALKWVYRSLALMSSVREQLMQQLKDNERLAHPGFVRTYSVEREPSSSMLFFTMEYVDGITLDRALARCQTHLNQPFVPITFTLRLLEEIVSLLHFAHSQQLIHRNLKPSNIGITITGEVKLMDAGIIKAVEESVTNRNTSFGGMLYYMAPEQLRQRGEPLTPAADVFSLGAIAYQLLTGELPLGAVVPPSQYVDSLPPEIDGIILRALEPRPARRTSSPHEFWGPLCEALAPLAASEQVSSSSLYTLLLAHLPEAFSADMLDAVHPIEGVDADTTNEVLQIKPTNSFKHLQDEVESPTSADLPVVPALPASTLLSRQATPGFSRTAALQESQSVKALYTAASTGLENTSLPIESTWTTHLERSDEMISLEGGATPPPPPTHRKPRSSSSTSDLSSEISRISAISSLAASPIAQELELELEEESNQNGPKLEDLKRKAIDLPEPPEGIQQKPFLAKDGTILFLMARVSEGPFLMGSMDTDPLASPPEIPQRKAHVDEFWISRTPITNRMWLKFIEESGYHSGDTDYLRHWSGGRPGIDKLEHPVVFISHIDAIQFCQFYQLSLPTEAQWEKAARGVDGQIWPWGNQKPAPGKCNFLGAGIHAATPVAAYPAGMSPFGLFDCSGNTWEWCRDTWEREWLAKMGQAPQNPIHYQATAGYSQTIRGGCFRNYGRGVRCATRHYSSERAANISMRVVSL